MKFLFPLFVASCALGFAAVLPEPGPVEVAPPVHLPNGCLVSAYEYECAVSARNHLKEVAWARLVSVQRWKEGHAYCVFALRNGDLWAYDTLHGSIKLNTRNRDIDSIVGALKSYDTWIRFGKFAD